MNLRFENDVKTYSIQTITKFHTTAPKFENDVKTYSIQTTGNGENKDLRLRMM